MGTEFNAAQIADYIADSDSLTRFIAGLTLDQAKACIAYELGHEKRTNVLALLSSQASAKTPMAVSAGTHPAPAAGLDLGLMRPQDQGQILNALQMARAHVRCPLDGNALADLRLSLDKALALMGVR